ncbi:MAG TPA: universal stress protein [Bacillota bacterium]
MGLVSALSPLAVQATAVPVHMTPLGVSLGVVFATAVSWILWWMMHPPKAQAIVEKVVEVAKEVAEAGARVLVGTRGGPLSRELLTLACGLAQAENLPLTAIYVVELPMTLPLDADVPDEMKRAEVALAEAREVAKQHTCQVFTQISKARKAGRAIVDAANAQPTKVIVLGVEERQRFEDRIFGSTADFVVRHARCDVILERPSFMLKGQNR